MDQKKKPGPTAKTLKLPGDWESAVKKALQTPPPAREPKTKKPTKKS